LGEPHDPAVPLALSRSPKFNGRIPLILNPLWLTTALRWRLRSPLERWRHGQLGV